MLGCLPQRTSPASSSATHTPEQTHSLSLDLASTLSQAQDHILRHRRLEHLFTAPPKSPEATATVEHTHEATERTMQEAPTGFAMRTMLEQGWASKGRGNYSSATPDGSHAIEADIDRASVETPRHMARLVPPPTPRGSQCPQLAGIVCTQAKHRPSITLTQATVTRFLNDIETAEQQHLECELASPSSVSEPSRPATPGGSHRPQPAGIVCSQARHRPSIAFMQATVNRFLKDVEASEQQNLECELASPSSVSEPSRPATPCGSRRPQLAGIVCTRAQRRPSIATMQATENLFLNDIEAAGQHHLEGELASPSSVSEPSRPATPRGSRRPQAVGIFCNGAQRRPSIAVTQATVNRFLKDIEAAEQQNLECQLASPSSVSEPSRPGSGCKMQHGGVAAGTLAVPRQDACRTSEILLPVEDLMQDGLHQSRSPKVLQQCNLHDRCTPRGCRTEQHRKSTMLASGLRKAKHATEVGAAASIVWPVESFVPRPATAPCVPRRSNPCGYMMGTRYPRVLPGIPDRKAC